MLVLEATAQKYCRDCHFSRNKYAQDTDWYCASPQNIQSNHCISLVTGEKIPLFATCFTARISVTGCSKEAKWFMTSREFLEKELPTKRNIIVSTLSGRTSSKIGVDDI